MPPEYEDKTPSASPEERAADMADLYASDEKAKDVSLDFGDDLEGEIADDEEYVFECPECQGEVAEADTICPHCGVEFED